MTLGAALRDDVDGVGAGDNGENRRQEDYDGYPQGYDDLPPLDDMRK